MDRVYHSPKVDSKEEVKNILMENNKDELEKLGIAVGLCCPDWKYAQDICLLLIENEESVVRANAILGLAHIARTKGQLDKRLVKPIILRELRFNENNRSTILDAIQDINKFLGWSIGLKLVKKYRS